MGGTPAWPTAAPYPGTPAWPTAAPYPHVPYPHVPYPHVPHFRLPPLLRPIPTCPIGPDLGGFAAGHGGAQPADVGVHVWHQVRRGQRGPDGVGARAGDAVAEEERVERAQRQRQLLLAHLLEQRPRLVKVAPGVVVEQGRVQERVRPPAVAAQVLMQPVDRRGRARPDRRHGQGRHLVQARRRSASRPREGGQG